MRTKFVIALGDLSSLDEHVNLDVDDRAPSLEIEHVQTFTSRARAEKSFAEMKTRTNMEIHLLEVKLLASTDAYLGGKYKHVDAEMPRPDATGDEDDE